jgi:hypothetical protein|tara:strand:- start:136 stop:585 length:450 start_codon:yes stop_codon:yes gene_type:complete
MKKTLILILFFIFSCGYQPIYLNKNTENFEFSKIVFDGENKINRKLINTLSLKQRENDKNLNEILLKTYFRIEETSKNSKGQVQSYRSNIIVDVIISKNEKIVKNKKIIKSFSYGNKDKKFELVEYQNRIKENLIDEIIDELILFLNLR